MIPPWPLRRLKRYWMAASAADCAPSGEGDGGGLVVGVAAAADEGRISDTAGRFVEGATGRGGGGEVAVGVQGDGSDGVVGVERGGIFLRAGEGFVGEAGALSMLGSGKPGAFAGNDEFGVVAKGHAVGLGEGFGTGADEVDVRTFFKHEAGGLDGIVEALDAGDTAGAEGVTLHDEGVELDATVAGEEAAAAGVEGDVLFHDGDGGLDGGDSGAGLREYFVTGRERIMDAALVGGDHVIGNGPGSAMDEKDGLGGRSGGHRGTGYCSGRVGGGARNKQVLAQCSGRR
jgi:hypothetical protein